MRVARMEVRDYTHCSFAKNPRNPVNARLSHFGAYGVFLLETSMKKGWIKLHRQIKNSWVWEMCKNDPFSKREAWIDLLLEAAHKDNEFMIGGQWFTCKRGQQFRSLQTLAKEWNWSKSKVRRFLKTLQDGNKIETVSVSKTTQITICNYDIYNEERNADETQVKRKRNASETHLAPNKNVENANNENNEKKTSSTKSNSAANAQKGKAKYPKVTDEHLQLAQELYDRLVEMYDDEAPLRRTNIRAWANDIRLLLEESKETPESVSKFIKFLHTDKGKVASFWKTNILSGKKIRERIAEVRLKAREEKRIEADQQQRNKYAHTPDEKIPHRIIDEHGDDIPNPELFPDAAFKAQGQNKRRRYLKQLAEQEAAQKETGA